MKTLANIKTLGIDMINEAKSGHPGIVLSAAPIIYNLYKEHLNINPNDPNWYNRDRFIMSAGHGSALLYATLYMCGFDLSVDDLKNFRTIDSKTPGHPELITPGVECATGPLGEGIATSVGIALGEKIINARINNIESVKNTNPVDFKTYVLVGDGDLMEGLSYEACSLAGTLNLDNLIILYDSNDISLDGKTDKTFKEDKCARFEAMGFSTYYVSDGNNFKQLNNAINKAKKSRKPSFIEIKTHLGYGSFFQDTNKVHGTPLTREDIINLKSKLNIEDTNFYVDNNLRTDLIGYIANRVGRKYEESMSFYNSFIKNNLTEMFFDVSFFFDKTLKYDYDEINFQDQGKTSMRNINKYVLNEMAKINPRIIVGSADLNSSTKVYIDTDGDISSENYNFKNIWYGVRENAMASISNGLSLLGFIPITSTFLTFANYMMPGIRLSALMNLEVIYTYTHDSVTIGKDGPTHQPIEQLSQLRLIPNLDVYRPCDLKEIIGSYMSMIRRRKPSALIISRNEVEEVINTSSNNALNGGYVIKDFDKYYGTLISTGSDMYVACKIANILESKGINLRVISIPSLSVFDDMDDSYKKTVLGNKKIIALESSNSLDFCKYTSYKNIININKFGYSGDASDILKKLEFDEYNIIKKILNIISQ